MKIEKTVRDIEVVSKVARTVEEHSVTLSPDDIKEAISRYLESELPGKAFHKANVVFLHRVVEHLSAQEQTESEWDGYGHPGGVSYEHCSVFDGAKVLVSFAVLSEREVFS